MTKKNKYSTRVFESKTIKIMKVTTHVRFHHSCESCFSMTLAKIVDLHKSLKANFHHFTKL